MTKIKSKSPKLYENVLDAIAILKEAKGSSEKAIMKMVDELITTKRKQLQRSNLSTKKALNYGLRTGMLSLKNGRYLIQMSTPDYHTYRIIQQMCADGKFLKEFTIRKAQLRKEQIEARKLYKTRQSTSSIGSEEPEECGRGRRGKKRPQKRKSRSKGGKRKNKVSRKRDAVTGPTNEEPMDNNNLQNNVNASDASKQPTISDTGDKNETSKSPESFDDVRADNYTQTS